ncbi:hypothetical protein JD844_033058 [Phrynosoma platyrhinos]|uniref:G-protein coupled receptors family 1 profile domain-containing protein n=1 Tax=Phrynosoma platyrhinos TaxID=52577 RepID=A0ABQ7T603_PHRPL|nr:hypothetical protein JD844_033058 [Phrynosoma platyrhinos]
MSDIQVTGGVWNFSRFCCDMFVTMDVMMCTASILNLCAISIDRYTAVVMPVHYQYNTGPSSCRRVCIMITMVWLLAFAVSCPLLFGFNTTDDPSICSISDPDFVIYSSVVSFYLPFLVTLLLYVRIYIVLRQRQRKRILTRQGSCGVKACYKQEGMYCGPSNLFTACFVDLLKRIVAVQLPFLLDHFEAAEEKVNACDEQKSQNGEETVKVLPQALSLFQHGSNVHKHSESTGLHQKSPGTLLSCFQFNCSSDHKLPAEKKPLAPPELHQYCSVCHENYFSSTVDKESADLKVRRKTKEQNMEVHKLSNGKTTTCLKLPSKHPRTIQLRERKATQMLAIVLGTFIVCWLPFFLTHILNTHCQVCHIPPELYSATTWLGYVNSALNPVIYTTFNNEFRKAFLKILYC